MLPLFHAGTLAVLLLYCAVIGLLFLADLQYADAASFREAWTSPDIRFALRLSLVTSVVTVLVSLAVAVPAAFALSRFRFRGISVLDSLIDLTIVLPPLVMGISVLVFFAVGRGLTGADTAPLRWLGGLFARTQDQVVYTQAGIVVAQFICSAAFAVRVIKASFDEIDPRLEAVALTLGCTHFQAFRRVTLPLAKPGILAGAVLTWARAIGLFGPVMIVAGGVRGRTEVLPTSVYLEISVGHLELALAISLLMVGLALIVLVAFRQLAHVTVFGTEGSG